MSKTSEKESEHCGPSKKIKREFMIPFHGAQECSLIIPPGFSATAQQVDLKKKTEQKKTRCIATTVVIIFILGLKQTLCINKTLISR